jgi:ATP adenylyltransferase
MGIQKTAVEEDTSVKREDPFRNPVTVTEPAEDFAGVPDSFQRLWTPYRMAYIESDHPSDSSAEQCPFCKAPQRSDEDGLIVYRGETCFVVMNLYPYSPGHLLVCPYRHVSSYIDLTPEETLEFTDLSKRAIRTLQAVSAPQGFNLGMNQGSVAGAGIAAHLHQHVVPRWSGDTNFLPIVARTRAIPQLLSDARRLLAQGWVNTEAANG